MSSSPHIPSATATSNPPITDDINDSCVNKLDEAPTNSWLSDLPNLSPPIQNVSNKDEENEPNYLTQCEVDVKPQKEVTPKKRKTPSREYTQATFTEAIPQQREEQQGSKREGKHLNIVKPENEVCYYTFVTEGATPTLPQKNIQNNMPIFIVVDHINHTHIIYKSTTNNIGAKDLRIWNFIQPVGESVMRRGVTVGITNDEFKYWVSTLLIQGIEKIKCFGVIDATFMNVATVLHYSTGGPSKEGPCLSRNGKPEKVVIVKSRNEIDFDYVKKLSVEKKASTLHTLYQKMSRSEFKALYSHLGTACEQKIKVILELINPVEYNEDLNISIIDSIIRTEITQTDVSLSDQEKWLKKLFQLNGIDLINFLAWFVIVADKRHPKVNTFVILGPSNCGKTLLLNTLLEGENVGITVIGSGRFVFQNLINKKFGLFEELDIRRRFVNYFKLLFEGAPIEAEFKKGFPITLNRSPIFTSSTQNLEAFLSPIDKVAFKTHIKEFFFKKQIFHPFVTFKDPCEAPPHEIKRDIWVQIFTNNRKDIENRVETILEEEMKST